MGLRMAIVGGFTGATLGIIGAGLYEMQTDSDAAKHEKTAVQCLGNYSGKLLSRQIVDCLTDGVPGGAKISPSDFHVADKTASLQTYILHQQHEQDTIHLTWLLGAAGAGFVLGGLGGAVAGMDGVAAIADALNGSMP